ncbi:HECT-domain-containing protein [Mycena indigotica]|uniref:HECT-type E3 ubiquitin transferase n=1 Tax=Mycena indigotica TaxID=2126181 RepID=A0A8H6WF80_9AGAR|nr:HECT-domain-containing protein [Mycena indigotica]KAF7312618.1 HECT-domain-containing protein [Mycena indigotica]
MFFPQERKRQINLGGSSSNTSLASITDQAKARRTERIQLKRQNDSATQIQAWWRGVAAMRATRVQMRQVFEQDVAGLTGLRCLVLMGRDEEVLAKWSETMVERGESSLYAAASQPSWLVLVRQACFLLLRSVAASPQSSNVVAHLQVINMLVSPDVASRHLGTKGREAAGNILLYLLRRGFYTSLAEAIRSTPIADAKTSKSLPLLIPLTTVAFSVYPATSQEYADSFAALISSILTIPLLPNRLPLQSLTHMSSRLPFAALTSLPPLPEITIIDRLHLLANLATFIPPRYAALPAPALTAYVKLITSIFNTLPPNALEGAPAASTPQSRSYDSDSEDESRPTVSVVSTFSATPPPPLPVLDARTQKRLQTLISPSHLNTLLSITQKQSDASRRALFDLILALEGSWPSKRSEILGAIVVGGAGTSVIKELWRGSVRRANASSILQEYTRPSTASDASIPALLFLADLYNHALLTMGDDEFFGSSTTSGRNPLSLDELTVFSRLLLDVAFGLYQGPQDTDAMDTSTSTTGTSGPKGVRFTWEEVREKVTKCLVAIHARDSRRPFTPPDHWLVSNQIDIRSFVEAALFEEQQISTGNARAVTTRQIARLAPRLGILHNIPFSIPFSTRVQVFRSFIYSDILARGEDPHGSRLNITVRREHIAQDGFDRLRDADLKGRIGIQFIDQFGEEEAGIDGGGVFKEFFTSLCREVFDTDRGLWLANKKNELYPNPHTYAVEPHNLNWYRFIGRIIGKAMYEGILVDIAFAGFFLAKWLGKQSFLDDLASLDPELYNGLLFLKHYSGNPEDLSLNFTVATDGAFSISYYRPMSLFPVDFGVTKTINLIPNGSNIPVTKENRLQYIYYVSHYRLSRQIKQQSEAFFEGLSEIIDHKWLKMFNQQELQILIGGTDSPVDMDDLQGNTQYGGVFDANHPTIIAFWRVVRSFDQEQRRSLLRFVTSCSRPPLLGFKELIPNFAIRDAGSDELRLPTSSTCVNLLKLPRYSSEKVLRTKLMQAITANAGFDLS